MNKEELCRNSQLGRKVIHLGDEDRRVYAEELELFLTEGWQLGASDKHRKNSGLKHLGNTPWNKGTTGLMKPNNGTFKKGQIPWNKGLKGVQKSWSKGLTKENDARVAKFSASNKLNWATNDTRRAIVAQNARARKGQHLSPEVHEQFLDRNYITRKEHSSFNTSNPEDLYYDRLCSEYGRDKVIRNYRDKKRYPYRCDFYITTKDLFIELNLHWTHGYMPYDPKSEKCNKQLREWEEKAQTSQFYKNAIETWTVRDVNKRRIAEDNKLNYIVLYSIE